jgi:hypothetical protein
MRGGALPPAILFAALGLALATAKPRVQVTSLFALGVALAALCQVELPAAWLEPVFLGCWVSAAITAAAVHLRPALGKTAALILSLNAALWSSSVVALSGRPTDALRALPAVLVLLPASWLIARRALIAVKVSSSWLMAIALLAAFLPFLPVTPGYLPDHLE